MKIKKILSLCVATTFVLAIAACKKSDPDTGYTYNTYTAISPSNWNELTYQDNNDTQIMSYIGSNFFEYDFKYDSNGKILDGQYEVKYSAATKLEDVTSSYAGDKWGITSKDTNRAYKITLREDLKWSDGTPIKAKDFVYTMKQQLDPLFNNYRADSFYNGATVIHNARNYFNGGKLLYDDNGETEKYEIADLKKGTDGVYKTPEGRPVYFALKEGLAYLGGRKFFDYIGSFDEKAAKELATLAGKDDESKDGRIEVTDKTIELMTTAISTEKFQEDASYLPNYLKYQEEYPELEFSEVGIFVGSNENELVIVLDKPLVLLEEDGSLSYRAAYNMSSLPLVKEETYEKLKKSTVSGGNTIWSTTYNSSVATTESWGPYKLTTFQAGKEYVLEKNENWYGYGLDMYEGQYQTTKIVCETIAEWNTAWLKFQAGEIDNIGIDVTIAADYKGSERAYFTPDDFVASLQLQSNKEALKNRETPGYNRTMLSYVDFRKALSLSINREDFATQTTTSSKAGFGLFNSMHYYDVANGGVYRDTDPAKKVLCDIYNVSYTDDTLDSAVDSITGYDLTTAKALVTKAYNEALANGDIKATDKVKITFGSAAINETVTRRFDYLQNAWTNLVVGTPLEGRMEYDVVDKGTKWAEDFRAGAYDVCMGGWSGAAWDPGYFLLAYLSEGYMYSKAWDTASAMLEFTMPGVGVDGADVTDTLSLMDWYNCLNGASGAKYNWGSGSIEESKRLLLIAALEKEVLSVYYTVPLYNNFGASLMSYKMDYVTYTYNTFMSYGGIRYATYNYNNAEWQKFVKDSKGQIDYRA